MTDLFDNLPLLLEIRFLQDYNTKRGNVNVLNTSGSQKNGTVS